MSKLEAEVYEAEMDEDEDEEEVVVEEEVESTTEQNDEVFWRYLEVFWRKSEERFLRENV